MKVIRMTILAPNYDDLEAVVYIASSEIAGYSLHLENGETIEDYIKRNNIPLNRLRFKIYGEIDNPTPQIICESWIET